VAERARLQFGQSVAPAGAAGRDRPLVADQLAAAAGENRRTARLICVLLLVAADRGVPDAAAVCRHAAEDGGAAVVGGITRVQSGADFDDAGTQKREERLGKKLSPDVASLQDVKPAPGAA
jgi:hypothetical protein